MTTTTLPRLRSADRAPRPDPLGRRYGRMWRRVPRELGYLALTAVIGLVTLQVVNDGLLSGGGSGEVLLAVLLSAGLLVVSRSLGAFELRRLRWARTAAITPPTWGPVLRGKRPLQALGDVFGGGRYWMYALHSLVVNPLLAAATTVVWLGWLVTAALLTTSPVWARSPIAGWLDPATRPDADAILLEAASPADVLVRVLQVGQGEVDPAQANGIVAGLAALGLLMLALLPLVTRGTTLAHWGLARLLLRRSRSEDLVQDVARADAARLAAVVAEDTGLRRLERDIHDGPQQRLLRLQMELATAERRSADSPAAAESIATARALAAETLDELRALAQGFAPPLLQDRGLSAALGALGRRGAVPVETSIDLAGEVPDAVERSVYFIAAELTTNAIKHGGASRVRLQARTEEDAAGRRLRLVVQDDGRGGAQVLPGHGLAGAVERVAGLGGDLTITSPLGGPTTVEARVPLR